MLNRAQDAMAQSEIRRRNLSRLLFELHLNAPLSRSQLATRLGLNRSTVASLVADLGARGLVRERRRLPMRIQPPPGRPSPVVELRQDGPSVLAVEISTDWLRTAVVGLGGTIHAAARLDRSLALMPPGQAADAIAELAGPLLSVSGRARRIAALGVSVPGTVRHEDGRVHHAPNLGWRDVPLGFHLRARFGDVPVFVSNDADLAALAEHLRGSGRGTSDFICLWGEGGMGAGLVLAGQRITGAAGYAGEVGHVMVDPAGRKCRCGSRGCWETEVAEGALLRRAGRDPLTGSAGIAELLADADASDPSALAALLETGRWLGAGLAGLVNIFNPSRIALGGFYARVYPYVRDAAAAELERRAMGAPRAMVELTVARLGADALLIGAAELALEPILRDPTIVPPIPTDTVDRADGSPRHGRAAADQAPAFVGPSSRR